MKELVLNAVSHSHYAQLVQVFTAQGIEFIKQDKKQPDTKELIFYCSPEVYLSELSSEKNEQLSFTEKLQEWRKQTEQKMNYALAHRDSVLIVDYDCSTNNPAQFILFLKETLDIDVTLFKMVKPNKAILAETCLQLINDDSVQKTYEDIRAAADCFNKTQTETASMRLHSYIVEIQKEIKAIKEDRNGLESDHQLGLLQIAQLQEELEFYFMKSQNNSVSIINNATPITGLSRLENSFRLASLIKGKLA